MYFGDYSKKSLNVLERINMAFFVMVNVKTLTNEKQNLNP
jgi:hypothetical protein